MGSSRSQCSGQKPAELLVPRRQEEAPARRGKREREGRQGAEQEPFWKRFRPAEHLSSPDPLHIPPFSRLTSFCFQTQPSGKTFLPLPDRNVMPLFQGTLPAPHCLSPWWGEISGLSLCCPILQVSVCSSLYVLCTMLHVKSTSPCKAQRRLCVMGEAQVLRTFEIEGLCHR